MAPHFGGWLTEAGGLDPLPQPGGKPATLRPVGEPMTKANRLRLPRGRWKTSRPLLSQLDLPGGSPFGLN